MRLMLAAAACATIAPCGAIGTTGAIAAQERTKEDISHLPEAKEAFQQRQRDLVQLARHLGALHRLDQLCGSYSNGKYRRRLQTLIPLEAPMGRTRLDMTEAFNAAYRDMSRLYLSCSGGTWAAIEREARAALGVVDRLYRPFR